MPGPPPTTVVNSEQGCVIAIVHLDHTVDVYRIPPSATITIQPQTGFGSVVLSSNSVSKASAESDMDSYLITAGAL